ncbi:MAG: DTW domain-containing protein [Spirochaetia bacterium]|jgi:DTW domain-containing protein YfiP|nr:DTW domain-containing protein [Spirochaetia bacterium]
MTERCLKCFRPVHNCYCKDISPIKSNVKFVFLMHPHEAKNQRTGTGRLASLSLQDSEIIVDKSFDNNFKTQELISNPSFYPMVLYPGEDAQRAESFDFREALKGRTLLIFLIDATWREAIRMMHLSSSLQKLPRLSFTKEYRSQFRIKTQPKDYCLSTIESSYYLLKELQCSGVCDSTLDGEGLMDVFKKMVDFQIECKEKRVRG